MTDDTLRAEKALFAAYEALRRLQPGAPAGRLPDLVRWVLDEAERLRLLPAAKQPDEMGTAAQDALERLRLEREAAELRQQNQALEAEAARLRVELLVAQGAARDAQTNSVPDEKLLWGVVHNAGRKGPPRPLWAAVREACAVGSTTAHALCIRFGLDPDTVVGQEPESPDEDEDPRQGQPGGFELVTDEEARTLREGGSLDPAAAMDDEPPHKGGSDGTLRTLSGGAAAQEERAPAAEAPLPGLRAEGEHPIPAPPKGVARPQVQARANWGDLSRLHDWPQDGPDQHYCRRCGGYICNVVNNPCPGGLS